MWLNDFLLSSFFSFATASLTTAIITIIASTTPLSHHHYQYQTITITTTTKTFSTTITTQQNPTIATTNITPTVSPLSLITNPSHHPHNYAHPFMNGGGESCCKDCKYRSNRSDILMCILGGRDGGFGSGSGGIMVVVVMMGMVAY